MIWLFLLSISVRAVFFDSRFSAATSRLLLEDEGQTFIESFNQDLAGSWSVASENYSAAGVCVRPPIVNGDVRV